MAETIVGLDIGTSAIRAVEISASEGSRPVLLAFGQVGLPTGAVVSGEIRDRTTVVTALQRLWREGGFTQRKVRLGIAGLRAITRELDLPAVPANELDSAARFQADELVPFPLEDTVISAKVIATYEDDQGRSIQRVLVAAAHRNLIDGVVAAVEEAGLLPVNIDLATAALARALVDGEDDGTAQAIVSVGAGLTLIVVHQRGVLQFVRSIDLGGNSVTAAIAGALDLPFSDAEQIKRRLGEGNNTDARALTAAGEAVDELIGEVQSSLRYFASLPSRTAVSRIFVTGGAARTVGLLPKLQQSADAPVLPASPLSLVDTSRLPISPDQAASMNPTLAVPVGLALDGPGGRGFNLLPPEVLVRAEEQRFRRYLLAGAVGVVALLVGLSVWRVIEVNNADDRVTQLQAQITTIDNVDIPKYDVAVQVKNTVDKHVEEIDPVLNHEVDWLAVFNEISTYTTQGATLSDFDMTAGSLGSTSISNQVPGPSTVIGTVTATVNVANLNEVTAWGEEMMSSAAFKNVLLSSPVSVSGSTVTFSAGWEIDGLLKGDRVQEYTEPKIEVSK